MKHLKLLPFLIAAAAFAMPRAQAAVEDGSQTEPVSYGVGLLCLGLLLLVKRRPRSDAFKHNNDE